MSAEGRWAARSLEISRRIRKIRNRKIRKKKFKRIQQHSLLRTRRMWAECERVIRCRSLEEYHQKVHGISRCCISRLGQRDWVRRLSKFYDRTSMIELRDRTFDGSSLSEQSQYRIGCTYLTQRAGSPWVSRFGRIKPESNRNQTQARDSQIADKRFKISELYVHNEAVEVACLQHQKDRAKQAR